VHWQAGVALTLCQQLATSMGPGIRQHVRVLGPGIVTNFGDSKVSVDRRVYLYYVSLSIYIYILYGASCAYYGL